MSLCFYMFPHYLLLQSFQQFMSYKRPRATEECQPETYEIGGDSLDSDLDWFPERRCKNESAPGEVETFLHSTKSSKKTADNQSLKLETLQTNSRRGRMARGTEAAI